MGIDIGEVRPDGAIHGGTCGPQSQALCQLWSGHGDGCYDVRKGAEGGVRGGRCSLTSSTENGSATATSAIV